MTEIWNKEADYTVRSKDEKYKVNVEYWTFHGHKGVNVEIRDISDSLLHYFSIMLDKRAVRMDAEG